MSPKKKKGYDDYEIEDAVRTLIRAEEIKQDPKLMKACSSDLAKKVKAIKSVAQIKAKTSSFGKDKK